MIVICNAVNLQTTLRCAPDKFHRAVISEHSYAKNSVLRISSRGFDLSSKLMYELEYKLFGQLS